SRRPDCCLDVQLHSPSTPAPRRSSALSLHDALPIYYRVYAPDLPGAGRSGKPDASYHPERLAEAIGAIIGALGIRGCRAIGNSRSEEHTSELQSREKLVCRLLLEKKNQTPIWLSKMP